MPTKTTATFRVMSGENKQVTEDSAMAKIAKANVISTFSGGITGEGILNHVLAYPTEDAAQFVGFQQIIGQIDDRKGSVVLKVTGTFIAGAVNAQWSVVEGTGTGELSGLSGNGGFKTTNPSGGEATLEYDI